MALCETDKLSEKMQVASVDGEKNAQNYSSTRRQ